MNPARALERSLERPLETSVERQAQGGGDSYTGPLDLVPGAVAAYGVRALSAAWLGQPLFRLKRSSDNAEMTFSADATTGDAPKAEIIAWRDEEGDAVASIVIWFDQSGNERDLIVESGDPQLLLDDFTGDKLTIWQDGVLTPDAFDITWASGACSAFIVSAWVDGLVDIHDTNSDAYVQIFPTSFQTMHISNEQVIPGEFAGGEIADPKPETGVLYLLDTAWQFGSREFYVNGAAKSFAQNFDDNGPISSMSGMRIDLSLVNMCEIILYDGLKNNATRAPARPGIASYWGITLP